MFTTQHFPPPTHTHTPGDHCRCQTQVKTFTRHQKGSIHLTCNWWWSLARHLWENHCLYVTLKLSKTSFLGSLTVEFKEKKGGIPLNITTAICAVCDSPVCMSENKSLSTEAALRFDHNELFWFIITQTWHLSCLVSYLLSAVWPDHWPCTSTLIPGHFINMGAYMGL